ncbi:MAG: ABC transporter permease, partial [Actinomycetes bacterium]
MAQSDTSVAGSRSDRPSGRSERVRAQGGLLSFTVRRLLAALGTLVFVLFFNFFLFRLLPGDPAAQYRGVRNISTEDLARIRAELSAPLPTQFWAYLRDPFALHGVSSGYGRPVWDLIGGRVMPTLILLGTSTIIATVVGVWIGIRSGWNRGSRFDKTATGVT